MLIISILIWVSKCEGASIIACARSNRHLIAFEADEEIFDGLLATFKHPIPLEEESGESASGDDYDSDEPYLKKPRTYIGVCSIHLNDLL